MPCHQTGFVMCCRLHRHATHDCQRCCTSLLQGQPRWNRELQCLIGWAICCMRSKSFILRNPNHTHDFQSCVTLTCTTTWLATSALTCSCIPVWVRAKSEAADAVCHVCVQVCSYTCNSGGSTATTFGPSTAPTPVQSTCSGGTWGAPTGTCRAGKLIFIYNYTPRQAGWLSSWCV